MGVGRLAPYRIRARYDQALREIPLPVRSFGGIDPDGLTTVAETEVFGRQVRFGVLYAIPRLWITLPEHVPPVLGFITGFDTTASGSACPELHITGLDHLDWARQPGRAAALKREAVAAWHVAQRECEG
ncbi:hypothetical protein [Glycomyces sp. YM15]|uniref:hypothetical protein n=1 Tax=Glycomyces sp. YM15 TaxID=2800446 RepID=UPI001964E8E4|nr:hypothetical protein [Glycomyces sp. YM15]